MRNHSGELFKLEKIEEKDENNKIVENKQNILDKNIIKDFIIEII
jgi:hypothetical protein